MNFDLFSFMLHGHESDICLRWHMEGVQIWFEKIEFLSTQDWKHQICVTLKCKTNLIWVISAFQCEHSQTETRI